MHLSAGRQSRWCINENKFAYLCHIAGDILGGWVLGAWGWRPSVVYKLSFFSPGATTVSFTEALQIIRWQRLVIATCQPLSASSLMALAGHLLSLPLPASTILYNLYACFFDMAMAGHF
jgi:hypothetical protein